MAGNLRLSREGKEKVNLVLGQIEEQASQLGNLLRTMAFSWPALEVKLIEIARKGTTIVERGAKLTVEI